MQQTVSATFSDLLDRAKENFDEQLIEFFERGEELVYQVRMPRNHTEPPGVFIYISPKPGATMPDAWGEVLDQHNLVWVGARCPARRLCTVGSGHCCAGRSH